MDIVLQQRVPGLGLAGEVVSVKTGYARHFLMPKGMAVFATEGTVKAAESMRKEAQDTEVMRLETLRAQLDKIKGNRYTLVRNADDNGQLYGSVSSSDVQTLLKEEGFNFEETDISFVPQKHIGTYQAMVKPEPESKATILISILSEVEAKEKEEKIAKATKAKAKAAKKSTRNDDFVDEEPKDDKPIVLV